MANAPYGAVLPLCHENHARWRLMSRAPWNNVLHPAVETAGLLLAAAPTAVRGRRMQLLKEPRKNDFFRRFIDPSFDPFFQFDPFLTHKKRVKLRQTTSNPVKGKSPGTRMIPGLFGVFSAC